MTKLSVNINKVATLFIFTLNFVILAIYYYLCSSDVQS